MPDSRPTVTIIIPARHGQEVVRALAASRHLDYSSHLVEIIIARGKQPSVQRNTALRAATGELIYFLDDDSEPQPENLQRAVRHFADSDVEVLGGPNICPADAPALEQVFALVLTSMLAFGPSRARYCRLGKPRETSEKELILCNLMARKATLLELGGFDESLYPNEENALMDNIQKMGKKLMYDPDFYVHRRPRPTFRAFVRMLLTYGRGRAEQFRVNPGFGSALNFVPPLFLVYLLLMPLAAAKLGLIALIPLGVYAMAVLVETVMLSLRGGFFSGLPAGALVVLTHLLYGAGFWRGLFTSLKRSDPIRAEVLLEPQSASRSIPRP